MAKPVSKPKPAKKLKSVPGAWSMAPSLRPGVWLSHAVADGDEEAQAIAEAYRFRFPVTTLSGDRYEDLLNGSVFSSDDGEPPEIVEYPRDEVIVQGVYADAEDSAEETSAAYKWDADGRKVESKQQPSTADMTDLDPGGPSEPSEQTAAPVMGHEIINKKHAEYVAGDMAEDDFALILRDFSLWKSHSQNHDTQQRLTLSEDFAQSFVLHIVPRLSSFKGRRTNDAEDAPPVHFSNWLETCYFRFAADQYRAINEEAALFGRAKSGQEEDSTWIEYAFFDRKTETEKGLTESTGQPVHLHKHGAYRDDLETAYLATQAVRDVLATLSPEDQALAQMMAGGFQKNEIGEILETSQPTIRRRVRTIEAALSQFAGCRKKGAA